MDGMGPGGWPGPKQGLRDGCRSLGTCRNWEGVTLGTVEKLLEPGLVCVLFRAGTEIDGGGLKWHSNSQCLGQLAGFRDQDGAGWQ